MNNFVLRAHPTIIARLIKPYLFVLILPLIRAVIQYLVKGEINGFLAMELMLLAVLFLVAVLGWRAMSITANGDFITLKKGLFIKSCAVIEISRLSSVSITRNIFDYLFGSAECHINTEAGSPKKSDFVIKLSTDDANALYSLVYGAEKAKTIKFSPLRIALLAATTSSAFTGIIVGVPIINHISDLVGIAIADMLLNEINHVSSKFGNVFPPIVNTITVIFLIAYGISFLISFFRNINFRLKSGKNIIEVKTGWIYRKKIVFKKSKINNVCIEQTPLMRVLKKHSMRVSIGGYGDDRGAKAVIVPIAKYKELKQQLKKHFPWFDKAKDLIVPSHNAVGLCRLLLAPTMIALAIVCAIVVLISSTPYFDRLVLFLGAVMLLIDLYFCSVCFYNYKYGQLSIGDKALVSGASRLTVRELHCNKNNVGIVKIVQTPADRQFKTCKVKVVVRSENADDVKVKNVDIDAVINQLNNAFNLNIEE